MNRYVVFVILVVVSVFADQVTKQWAVDNLASRSSRWEHYVARDVDEAQNGLTVEEWVGSEFELDMSDDSQRQLARSIFMVGEDGTETGPLSMSYRVQTGDDMRVYHREMVVVPGFWHHIYVQNFGAAWGMFSEQHESFRRPFFMIVAILAVVVVLWIFRGLRNNQLLMASALSFIVGGAVGNFIDRVRYGYVIDFIDWFIVLGGEEKHWPTFNIADVAISIGVGLMAIEILTAKPAPTEPASAPAAPEADPAA